MEDLILNMRVVLGTAFSLYLTTHGAHWNVEGATFYALHAMYKDQYEEIWGSLDDIAEQIRALDAYAPFSMQTYQELSLIEEAKEGPFVNQGMLLSLMDAHEILIDQMTICMQMATEQNQQGLANFLGGRIEAHQKHRWMLRSTARSTV